MQLTKQTKLYLGIGLLGVAGYLIWKEGQKKQNFIRSRSRSRGGRATNIMTEFGDRPRPVPTLVTDSPISQRFLPQGCKDAKGACKDVDKNGNPTGYIYCGGKDENQNRNFATKIQNDTDGSIAASLQSC
jgi:hypothetical protein